MSGMVTNLNKTNRSNAKTATAFAVILIPLKPQKQIRQQCGGRLESGNSSKPLGKHEDPWIETNQEENRVESIDYHSNHPQMATLLEP